MIFATGFAPFRGGPMHYARTRGFADVRDTLKRLAATIRAALPARSGLGQPAMIHSGAGAGAFRRSGAACRRDHRKSRQDHRARLAARSRQGQPHRQCALSPGRGRPLDPADHLHRADAGAAARQERAGTPLPRSDRRNACSPAIRRSTMRRRSAPARCRPTSRSTNSSSRPGNGSVRPTRSSITSPPTTPMRCATCSTAASTSLRNWWRTAPTRRRIPIA